MKTSNFCTAVLLISFILLTGCSENFLTPAADTDIDKTSFSMEGKLFWQSEGFTLNAWGEEFVSKEICSQQSLSGLGSIMAVFTTSNNTETEGYSYEVAVLGDAAPVTKLVNNGQTNNSYQMYLDMGNCSMIRIYASLTKTGFVLNPAAFIAIENVKIYRLD